MTADSMFLVAGLALLLGVTLPWVLERAWLSTPLVLIGVGGVIGLLPLPDGFVLDPVDRRPVIEHVTEVTVLVALMGVGLALDRSLSFRTWRSWRQWGATWKLLGIAMPLTIGGVFLLGWLGLGLGAASALLLASALAPTDPVLAGDVQVGGPATGQDVDEDEITEDDEVRFALTSEAGLNDGLAFPFVYAAIFLASAGPPAEWVAGWVAWELAGKVAVGVGIGVIVGWGLAHIAFRSPAPSLRLAEQGEPLLAVAALVLAYGASEVLGGYGFLAVFSCALALRAADRSHRFHERMHGAIEALEQLLTLTVLLFVGVGLADGTLAHLDWRGVVLGIALVFAIRPVAAWLALSVGRWQLADERHRPLARRERAITAFFGIRGVGTLYYLAYATGQAHFADQRWLWSTATFTVVLSVVVHGVAATPVMLRLEEARELLSRRAPA